jgi:hypothetical protein
MAGNQAFEVSYPILHSYELGLCLLSLSYNLLIVIPSALTWTHLTMKSSKWKKAAALDGN